jgi:hypothetical protein
VRIARDFGTIDQLLPDGVTDVRDCPHVLFHAIRVALMVIGFDWLDNDRLSAWFKDIDRKRRQKYGLDKGPGAIDDPVANDAARSLIVGG